MALSKPSVAVGLCDDIDIDHGFRVVSRTFKHDEPYIDAVYPRHDTLEGFIQGRDRMLKQKHSDQIIKFVKATDSNAGKIIGLAIWLCIENKSVKDQLEGIFGTTKRKKNLQSSCIPSSHYADAPRSSLRVDRFEVGRPQETIVLGIVTDILWSLIC